MKNKKQIFIGIFLVVTMFLVANFVSAQDFGLEPIEENINLGDSDPRAIVGRLVNIALSFLGVIVLGLIIYSGFLWMTSGGDEEKVRKAKGILKNAIIGLVITLSAWAIATFIINSLWGATTGSETNFQAPSNNNLSSYSGLGAIGSCSVESVYPENAQKDVPRNASIIATFKEPVALNSVCVDSSGNSCECNNGSCALINPQVIRIYTENLGDACSTNCPDVNTNITDVAVAFSSDRKTLVLSPYTYLGSQESKVEYVVKITADLQKQNGSSMFRSCSSDSLEWGFEVSTKLDLTPPQVISGQLFPQPDNEADVSGTTTDAVAANAEIFVMTCPNVYSPARLISVTPETEVSLNYHGEINRFIVSIPANTPNKAQLHNANTNALLGIADFDDQDIVSFNDYFSLKAENRTPGNMWAINIVPEQKADSLTIGNTVYIFSTTSENNNILVNQSNCNTSEQAQNIHAKVSGNNDASSQLVGNRILLTSKVAGTSGNGIDLLTTNYNAFELTPFSGGADSVSNYQVRGLKDTAMNTVVKINFNEAMNPITLSGPASEVSNYIKIVNANPASLASGSACSLDSDCRSYNCQSSVCLGDYINGRFALSSGYRTVEFISDRECGINGCGETVYCLPPSSNLAVEIRAADLKACSGEQDCISYNPFNSCSLGSLGYRTCQDSNQRNYPLADIFNLNGIVDSAFNSLDGNRDSVSDGPIAFFNENINNVNSRDSYQYSFFVSNQKQLSSPEITAITPVNGESDILNLTNPVEITFNTLMMSSTLRSGGAILSDAQDGASHKFVNLKTAAQLPLGYWISSVDVDSNPLDGVSDITKTEIRHSPFQEAISYSAQAGSGVKDVYQNCFKPSSGPGCQASWENPSCCFGSSTNLLDEEGNCQE